MCANKKINANCAKSTEIVYCRELEKQTQMNRMFIVIGINLMVTSKSDLSVHEQTGEKQKANV